MTQAESVTVAGKFSVVGGRVGIVCGSRSDFPVMEKAVELLGKLQIGCELHAISAHRAPDLLFRFIGQAQERGISVFIAGAGGAAHLPGVVAAKTILPVIGVPIPTQVAGGLDSLLSIVQMPKGVPVATVAIGGAENAALLAAEILAIGDAELAARVRSFREAQTRSIEEDESNVDLRPRE
jgi:5-(carboxyamino)imidazole ribonucleotide mutase